MFITTPSCWLFKTIVLPLVELQLMLERVPRKRTVSHRQLQKTIQVYSMRGTPTMTTINTQATTMSSILNKNHSTSII